MPVQPLGDRVLVQRLEEEEEKTSGGIFIPDTAKEKPQRGKVIAVGAGRLTDDGKRLPMDVKVGDEVLFGKYSGSDIKIDGVEYLIIKEDEIYGLIAKKKKK
ncbi:molecular chaperone GroES [candidate division BRC1 bacterium SM23_51]|nr:MAG: molecular chaperone GroES [candidate division BRC1 bacterium SM23_51]